MLQFHISHSSQCKPGSTITARRQIKANFIVSWNCGPYENTTTSSNNVGWAPQRHVPLEQITIWWTLMKEYAWNFAIVFLQINISDICNMNLGKQTRYSRIAIMICHIFHKSIGWKIFKSLRRGCVCAEINNTYSIIHSRGKMDKHCELQFIL